MQSVSPDWIHQALGVGTALAAGLLIGIERGWKLRDARPGTRVAGVRTFSMLGLGSGIAGLLGLLGHPLVAAPLVAGAVAVMVIAYARQLEDRHDSTSAVAAIATIAIGFLAGNGAPGLAIASAAVAVALLALRTELHGFVERLDADDVKALARYAVIAGAVLPFLPSGHYGPLGAWDPQKLWWVVVIVTGFSFLGYATNRIFGERHGTIATAVIGGLYSSTAVTQSLAQRLGTSKRPGAEPAGIALATAVMYVRVLVLVGIIATRLFVPFALIVLPAIITGAAAGWWLYRKAPRADAPTPPGNPIALVPALGFLIFVAVTAVLGAWAEGRFGQQGLALLLLITGSMNVDVAIVTAGGLPANAIGAELAALALAGTIVVNMAVKIGITLVYARAKGLAAAAALTVSVLVLATTMGIAWARL
jgi:uncharacterized membrane protein (DUF4010 family)